MSASSESPGARMRALWARLAPLPGGRWLFSRLVGWMVPYTGSVRATVLEYEPGRARVRLRDRRAVRNHLGSVHAIALANVGELATGLAVIGALGPELRGILTGLEVTYLKKARGHLHAEAVCPLPDVAGEPVDHPVRASIRDEAGDEVATVTAHWRIGPVRRTG